MSRPRVEFRPAQVTDEATMRNFRDLTRIVARLQQEAAAAASSPARVFVGPEKTGVGPWEWTDLNGDEPGLAGYEIVGQTTDNTATASSIGLTMSGDTAANYGDASAGARNQCRVITNAGDEVTTTVINIPIAKSGYPRVLTAISPRSDATPETLGTLLAAFVWNSNGLISSMKLDYWAGGPVVSASFKLYKLMDVAG